MAFNRIPKELPVETNGIASCKGLSAVEKNFQPIVSEHAYTTAPMEEQYD